MGVGDVELDDVGAGERTSVGDGEMDGGVDSVS